MSAWLDFCLQSLTGGVWWFLLIGTERMGQTGFIVLIFVPVLDGGSVVGYPL